MDDVFLTTKLRIPLLPHYALHRIRLVDVLERAVPAYKLILVSAPVGYGKTTLLSQWANATRFGVVWLSIGEEDNDIERFFRYLFKGWEAIHPSLQGSQLELLLSGQSPDIETVLAAFINIAAEVPNHLVFVLDDYHLIYESVIHNALAFLLDHLPPKIHIVLAGRADPPLPLARYRARQELMELRVKDLQFLRDETAEVLEQKGLRLGLDEVERLQTELEGWIAGLHLVALTFGQDSLAADKFAVSRKHRFIVDYLSEEVLARLPESIRQFLLSTSILDTLCGSLCNAVTETANGQEMLEMVERQNLFLMPLDDSREWFRYHALFAEFLRQELKRLYPEKVITLHRQAARWYLAHNLPEQAFHHAMKGRDVVLVEQLFDDYHQAKLMGGELRGLKHWLDSLPPEWYDTHPILGLAQAGFFAFSGALEACIHCVDVVEQKLMQVESPDKHTQLAKVTAVRCMLACTQNNLALAEKYADQALGQLPEADIAYRPWVYTALGDTYRQNGRWREAHDYYLKALYFTAAPAIHVGSVHVFGALADLSLSQGQLREAAGYWQKALAAIQHQAVWGHLPLPVIGWVYIRLGELLYEWNDLASAWEHLGKGLERAELGGDVRTLIAGYLLAGRIRLVEGDIQAAVGYLEQARPLVQEGAFLEWTSRFERFQIDLWLAQGMLRLAVERAEQLVQDLIKELPGSEVALLAAVRAWTARADSSSIERVLELLRGLLHTTETEGRAGIQIEALTLQAVAHWKRGSLTDALTSVERALRLAEPEGYVRLFTDLGLSVARLLQEARSRKVMPEYIEKLLAGLRVEIRAASSVVGALPEVLSSREQEILGLLAAGLTNREIGEKLVISPETVKKHVGSIFGKLAVGNRTEAVTRARELQLLD